MDTGKFLFISVLSGLLILLSFTNNRSTRSATDFVPAVSIQAVPRVEIYKNRQILSCSPDWASLNMDSMVATITVLPGWGNYEWPIQSSSDSARLYFQQGISMYYSFHIIEAMASFKKAGLFDDQNAMI